MFNGCIVSLLVFWAGSIAGVLDVWHEQDRNLIPHIYLSRARSLDSQCRRNFKLSQTSYHRSPDTSLFRPPKTGRYSESKSISSRNNLSVRDKLPSAVISLPKLSTGAFARIRRKDFTHRPNRQLLHQTQQLLLQIATSETWRLQDKGNMKNDCWASRRVEGCDLRTGRGGGKGS